MSHFISLIQEKCMSKFIRHINLGHMCDIWCIYRFGGLIDGYSALGVVYEV